jgi:hypothetical protein
MQVIFISSVLLLFFARKTTGVETKYMRKIAGYTVTDYKTKTEVAKELNKAPVLDKIQGSRRNCIQRVNRITRKKL